MSVSTTFLPEDADWAQREWELRKKNEEVEERQRHTQDFYFIGNQQEDNGITSEGNVPQKEVSALVRSLHQCKLHNDKLSRELDSMKRERATLLSDLKVARLQLRKPNMKGEEATTLDQMGREVAAARRELEEAKREAKKAKMFGEAEAVKAVRAREEVAKLKEAEKKATEEIKELRNSLEAAKSEARMEFYTKDKQHKQLIVAFKKQAELVHVLRQQKLHLEASRVLDAAADKDFVNNLDH